MRLRDTPPSLRRRIEQARERHGGSAAEPVALSLRTLADALLQEAKEGGDGRDAALTLLAADALVTYACEAVAETAPHRLGDLR